MEPRAYLRLIGLGALIGVPAALIAALFLALVHTLEQLLWHDLPKALGGDEPQWYLVLGLPVVGACLVFAARRFLPGDGGSRPLEGMGHGAVAVRAAPGIALAALGTLAFGGVLGPEAPLVALGSATGVLFTYLVRVDERGRQVAATAGSFSAVSALFGGPLVSGLLLIETGIALGSALIPVLIPGVVAAALGYVLFIGFGDWGGISAQNLAVPGLTTYDERLVDLFIAVGVGVVTAVVIVVVRQLAFRLDGLQPRRMGMGAALLAGGLAIGVLALVARALGADSQDVLFSGQASVPVLVDDPTWNIVLILLVAKGIGYAICLGMGFRGGPVFPAIFLGVAVASLAQLAFDTSPTLTVGIGAAAGMAAGTGLIFSSLLLAALLVGTPGKDTISATVLAAVAAWLTERAFDRHRSPRTATSPPTPADRPPG